MDFEETNKPNYIKWFFIIYLAVTTAILSADAIEAGLSYLAMVQITNKLTGEIINPDPAKVKTPRFAKKKDMTGYQTVVDTCNFWKEQFNKDRSNQNAIYMDAACSRLKAYR